MARSPSADRSRRTRVALGVGAGAAVLWAVVPLAFLAVRAHGHGTVFTGAAGPFPADQLQYLAWIRDESRHLLASDLFTLSGGGHVFLHPMFVLSGGLVRLGFPIQSSYLVWVPLAAALLIGGVAAYVRRTLPSGSWQQPAALALALLFSTPTVLLTSHLPSGALRRSTDGAIGNLFAAGHLGGYLPAAIAIGLMPLYFLALESIASKPHWKRGAFEAAGLGLAAAWLHPWQGATLLLATVGLAVWGRRLEGAARLAVPIAGTALPLVYYAVLPRVDAGWRVSGGFGRGPSLVALAGLALAAGPLLLPGLAGLRVRATSTQDRVLWLWPVATIVTYGLGPPFANRALPGLSIPLAILATRGWRRLNPALAIVGVAVLVVPGMVRGATTLRDFYRRPAAGYDLSADEARVLRYLATGPEAGGVLAPVPLASAVPAFTGHAVWAGHLSWTPDYERRADLLRRLYGAALSPPAGQEAVRSTGARFVIADCRTSPEFRLYLPPGSEAVRADGCVTLYRLPAVGDP